ncbi:DNA cytosine methyltransferase [Ochrobactrum sp. Sa2BUA5]|nr:DNA cytosine methyltransferase [Ochrobactrum gallinarum]
MKHDNDNNALRFLSVCSGIEAASVAWNPLGWQAVAFSEIEKFPSAVLAHHYPDVPNLGDFTKIDTSALGRVDILCGGTPCQAFSIAGARRSLEDARGNLTLAFVELAHELAAGNGLRNAVWENVPGVLSTKDNAFGCFLAGLVGADDPLLPPDGHKWPNTGMVAGPRARAAWRVLDAQYFGLAQRRKRVVVVADFGNGADPAAVLFERKGMSGNTPPSREPGQKVAPTISARPTGGGGLGTDFDLDGGLVSSTGSVAHCLNAGGMGRQDYETETMIAQPYTLAIRGRGESHDLEYRQDGTANALLTPNGGRAGIGVGAVCTPVHAIQAGALRENPASGPDGVGVQADVAYTLEARAEVQAVAFDWYASSSQSLPINGFSTPLKTTMQPAVAFAQNTRDEVRIVNGDGLIAGALAAEAGMKQQTYLQQGWAVRRLTPTECERLQGFPDGYTDIPWRNKLTSPDGPRYKGLGNSWAVPKFKWIGERIARLMPLLATNDNDVRKPDALLLAS